MSRSIVILLDGSLPAHDHPRYRIFHLARVWREEGLDVRIHATPDDPGEADLTIPHVDLSRLPDSIGTILDRREGVVNRRVRDIHRTTFSQNLLSEGDAYDGPAIVKTNANYGGVPEHRDSLRLTRGSGVAFRAKRLVWAVRRMCAAGSLHRLGYTDCIEPSEYPVYPSLDAVPHRVFANPHLVVEKFLPEREGPHYFLRSYAFFGSVGFAIRTRSPNQVVKGTSGSAPEFMDPHPDIVAARHRLGFDYGKFDYTIHDGEAVLFDVNTTPTFGPVFAGELSERMASRLAAGIRHWFPGLRQS